MTMTTPTSHCRTVHLAPQVRPRGERDEKGIALIIALFLTAALSALGASVMFISQTETYSSMNYRVMSQARYGAESGIYKTVHYLLNSYTPPKTGSGTDPISAYDTTKSPVEYNGQPVVLSALASVNSNYPVQTVKTAFSDAAQGSLAQGNTSVNYAASATMLSMQELGGQTVITWQLTADGTIPSGRPATVEVSSVLEKQVVRSISYAFAAFATANTCGALTWSSAYTDSYDSTSALGGNGKPVLANNNGNVGTNGNINTNNSATVNGTVSTPRVGVGNCSSGNVTASTSSGGATVTGGIVHLSQEVVKPTPVIPAPTPSATQNINVTDISNCPTGLSGCTKLSNGHKSLAPGTAASPAAYGNINLTNTARLHLQAGTYNFNSWQVDNASQIILDSVPVIINIVGTGKTQPFWLNSSVVMATGVANKWDPTNIVFNYAGTDTVRFDNAATQIGMVNAPNAALLVNSSDFYGSLIGKTITFGNAAKLHYDRNLNNAAPATFNVGADMLTAFTWKKY